MEGVKSTVVGLATLPTELIQRIGVICDVKSLGNLCMTCKTLNFVLSDEVVWKHRWQHICRHYNLVACDLDQSKTTYRAACLRSAICFYEGIFQNDIEAMTGGGIGWSHMRNAMAFDCGSKTARIAWLFDYFRSSCPAITAHLKVQCCCPSLDPSKQCTCQNPTMTELNDRLKTLGHPTLYRPVVVGQKAKLLLGQHPQLYRRDQYPIYYTQGFPRTARTSPNYPPVAERGEASVSCPTDQPSTSMDTSSPLLTPKIKTVGCPQYIPTTTRTSSCMLNTPNTPNSHVCTALHHNSSSTQKSNNASRAINTTTITSGGEASRANTPNTSCADAHNASGTNSHKSCQVFFQVCNPIQHGDIVNVRDYELLLRHLHGSVTGGSQQLAHMRDISRMAFLLCEPPRCTQTTRKALLKLMFEKLKVSRICLQNKAGLLPMDSSFGTCLVIDSGASSTVVTPIIDSRIQQDGVQYKPIGGLQVSLALADTITSKGLLDEVLVDDMDDRGIKEECWLAYQPGYEMRKRYASKNIPVHRPRSKPSYLNVPFGSERFLACEDMYRNLDLPDMITTALKQCAQQSHGPLLSRIILTGGNSSLKGFAQRLARDLKERLPQYTDVIMVSRFDDIFTLLTLLGPGLDQKRWITRAEYVIEGDRVLDRYQQLEAYA